MHEEFLKNVIDYTLFFDIITFMNKIKFLSICLNPVLQKTLVLNSLHENEVNRSGEYYFDASGKGVNVSRVLTELGEDVIHLTQVGGINKKLFLRMIKKDRINIQTVDSYSEIRYCYTLINKENKTTTEIVEEAEKVNPKTEKNVFEKFLRIIPKMDVVIISGTKASGFSDSLYPSIVKKAKQEGKKIILDIKGSDLKNSLEYKPDIIKPNLSEFASTFLNDASFKESHENAKKMDVIKNEMKELYDKYHTTVILTRGKFGTLYIDENKIFEIVPEPITPLNTIGCGDSFTAGFASSWSKDASLEESIKKAHECAKLNALNIRPGSIK